MNAIPKMLLIWLFGQNVKRQKRIDRCKPANFCKIIFVILKQGRRKESESKSTNTRRSCCWYFLSGEAKALSRLDLMYIITGAFKLSPLLTDLVGWSWFMSDICTSATISCLLLALRLWLQTTPTATRQKRANSPADAPITTPNFALITKHRNENFDEEKVTNQYR